MRKSATLSPCNVYRYSLGREWSQLGGETICPLFIGVNPSVADSNIDDATVRKWIGFCARWGYTRFAVVNLFAFRATNVKELADSIDPVGPDNDETITKMFDTHPDLIVPCWGSRGKLPRSLHSRIDLMNERLKNRNSMCLGKTGTGDPIHPLMLSYETPLIPYL